jgi:hypothetical protein
MKFFYIDPLVRHTARSQFYSSSSMPIVAMLKEYAEKYDQLQDINNEVSAVDYPTLVIYQGELRTRVERFEEEVINTHRAIQTDTHVDEYTIRDYKDDLMRLNEVDAILLTSRCSILRKKAETCKKEMIEILRWIVGRANNLE